jgi:hypothetical protein
VTFEAVPLVDEEQYCDGWNCEYHYDEKVAYLGDSLPAESSSAGVSCF